MRSAAIGTVNRRYFTSVLQCVLVTNVFPFLNTMCSVQQLSYVHYPDNRAQTHRPWCPARRRRTDVRTKAISRTFDTKTGYDQSFFWLLLAREGSTTTRRRIGEGSN